MSKIVKRIKAAKITSVAFRSSVQLAPFQHLHIEATAQVTAGQTPREALDHLKFFVAEELRRAKEGEEEPIVTPRGAFRIPIQHKR